MYNILITNNINNICHPRSLVAKINRSDAVTNVDGAKMFRGDATRLIRRPLPLHILRIWLGTRVHQRTVDSMSSVVLVTILKFC